MRCYLLASLCLLLTGCVAAAPVKPRVIIKTVEVPVPCRSCTQPPSEVIYIDKCPPPVELTKHCASKRTRDECDAEQRCHWREGPVRRPHCARIYCKVAGMS